MFGNFCGDSVFYIWLYWIVINIVKNYLVVCGCWLLDSDVIVEDVEFFEGDYVLKDIELLEWVMLWDEIEVIVY